MRQTRVAIVVPPRASLFELATPVAVWGSGRAEVSPKSLFETSVCSANPNEPISTSTGLSLSGTSPISFVGEADLVVVPTWPSRNGLTEGEQADCDLILEEVTEAHRRGATLAGLCLGAFALAEAGLLDGKSAVTHWAHRERFVENHANVDYVDDFLYVDLGDLITSAGSSAALDCCLHIVRQAQGTEVALRLARSLVTAPHRSGNQKQFVPPASDPALSHPIGRLLDLAVNDLPSIRSVADLAAQAGMSRRSLERAFAEHLGQSPGSWLTSCRVSAARQLLEETAAPIDLVANRVGFGSASTLRRWFGDQLGCSPSEYRSRFRATERP